jgi:hypothetical protein
LRSKIVDCLIQIVVAMCVKETVAPLSAETDVMILKNIFARKMDLKLQCYDSEKHLHRKIGDFDSNYYH